MEGGRGGQFDGSPSNVDRCCASCYLHKVEEDVATVTLHCSL